MDIRQNYSPRLDWLNLCLIALFMLVGCGSIEDPSTTRDDNQISKSVGQTNPQRVVANEAKPSEQTEATKEANKVLEELKFGEAMEVCKQQKHDFQEKLGDHGYCKHKAHNAINPSETKKQAQMTCQEHYLTCYRKIHTSNPAKCSELNLFTQLDHRCKATVDEVSSCLDAFAKTIERNILTAPTCTDVAPSDQLLGPSFSLNQLEACRPAIRKCPKFNRETINF